MDFADSADQREKIKKHEKRDKYLDLARERKKTVKHVSNGDTNYNWHTWNGLQRLGTVGNQRTSRDYPNYCIAEFG